MPYYECVFIARPDISATQAEGLTEQFATFVEENGGAIKLREQWGLRTLAYRIRKNRKGHYALLNIEAPAPVIEEMNRLMRLNEDIMRHLTVRVDELSSEPSIMMTSRASRDDRDRPRRREFNRDSSGPGGVRGGDREDNPRRDTDGPKEETSE